jgi:cell division cycle 20-like protein 1 (cofactor of APC complex)
MFSKSTNELVSTHGYSDNAIVVWKYPSLKKVSTLTGHSLRVLYLAMSPDADSVVTGAGDETLRFWKLFPKNNKGLGIKTDSISKLDQKHCLIR